MEQDTERLIMELIMNGGDARSFSLKAIQAAEKGNIDEASRLLEQSNESINKAHGAQARLLQEEIRGKEISLNLLIIHAQDHVMNAITVRDLAIHIVQTQEDIHKLKAVTKGGIQ